jgi:GTP-binding protein SAR1
MRRLLLVLAVAAAAQHGAHAAACAERTSLSSRSAVHVPPLALRLRGGAESATGWRQWWYKTLAKFGIFLKKGRLLVLGLDNAGKSTLLTVLMRNEVVPTAPTHQPVTDEIKIGHMKLRAVDMGGHEIARRMWVQYSHEADGIVYIVDAVDRERFEEAAVELHKLLAASSLPPSAPVLILANKVDLPHAASQEELWYGLGLDELQQQGSTRPIVRASRPNSSARPPVCVEAPMPPSTARARRRGCICARSSSGAATVRASTGCRSTSEPEWPAGVRRRLSLLLASAHVCARRRER